MSPFIHVNSNTVITPNQDLTQQKKQLDTGAMPQKISGGGGLAPKSSSPPNFVRHGTLFTTMEFKNVFF
ncbi:MAG: hypothetical protein DWI29_03060 [Planctomycetota bacterium]|nr:MAG: hypothetical protein DWI29_03060 [Planctomycetota bacterium]